MPDSETIDLAFDRVAVIGAGTMGHGIAQVCAQAGAEVVLFDVTHDFLETGLARIRKNLDKGVEKGKVAPDARETTLARISGSLDLGVAIEDAGLVIEAVPEKLDLKQGLIRDMTPNLADGAVIGTNTSSLSVARISEAAPDPSRVLGMHFFNPVFIMKLLELVHHERSDPAVLERVKAFGSQIGKECIVVRDSPGFATSRLGVCLGMEAIRMYEEGVASAADIDTAMVLGYRHPIGPLRLTDLIGLDVRLAIGEYLSKELGNDAFNPPDTMRQMVAAGKLGQKSGAGFYDWS